MSHRRNISVDSRTFARRVLAGGTTSVAIALIGAAGGCGMFSGGSNSSAVGPRTIDAGGSVSAGEPPAAEPDAAAGEMSRGAQEGREDRLPGGRKHASASESPSPIAMPSSSGTSAWMSPESRIESADADVSTTFNLQQVTFAQEGSDFDPAVSRDGGRVVFASTQHRPTADLYVKTVSGRTITQLTNDPAEDGMPDISPDGSKVAFASNRNGNWDVFVVPITGGKPVQVTMDESDELHPSWSPDGEKLVFCRMGPTSGRWELWVADASKATNASFIGYGLFPRWCPVAGTGADGADRIVFQLGRERGQRSFAIWTLDFAFGSASNFTQIATDASSALINPSWSPDGRHIVYASVPNGDSWPGGSASSGGPPSSELWLASVEGDASVKLTSGSLRALRPAWGAANRLYFVSSRHATENIWSIDLYESLASIGAMNVDAPIASGGATSSPRRASAGSAGGRDRGERTASTKPTPRQSEPPDEPMDESMVDPSGSTADAGEGDVE